jgi:hypothetical protein
MLIIPIVYFLICGVTGLILWFRMLGVLESKGRKVNYLWVTPRQFVEFSKVIKEENDSNLKKNIELCLGLKLLLFQFS